MDLSKTICIWHIHGLNLRLGCWLYCVKFRLATFRGKELAIFHWWLLPLLGAVTTSITSYLDYVYRVKVASSRRRRRHWRMNVWKCLLLASTRLMDADDTTSRWIVSAAAAKLCVCVWTRGWLVGRRRPTAIRQPSSAAQDIFQIRRVNVDTAQSGRRYAVQFTYTVHLPDLELPMESRGLLFKR